MSNILNTLGNYSKKTLHLLNNRYIISFIIAIICIIAIYFILKSNVYYLTTNPYEYAQTLYNSIKNSEITTTTKNSTLNKIDSIITSATLAASSSKPSINVTKDKYTLVLYFKTGCPYCKKFMDSDNGNNPVWQNIKSVLPLSPMFNILEIDCTVNMNECVAEQGLKTVPTLVLVNNNTGVRSMYNGDRSFNDIEQFLNKYGIVLKSSMSGSVNMNDLIAATQPMNTKVNPVLNQETQITFAPNKTNLSLSDSVTSDDANIAGVNALPNGLSSSQSTFWEFDKFTDLQNGTSGTLTLYYRTTCPRCQQFMGLYNMWSMSGNNVTVSTWDNIKYNVPDNLQISEIDCSANKDICEANNIRVLPTIILQLSNARTFQYSGDYSYGDIGLFLRNNGGFILKDINNTQLNTITNIDYIKPATAKPYRNNNLNTNLNNNLNSNLNNNLNSNLNNNLNSNLNNKNDNNSVKTDYINNGAWSLYPISGSKILNFGTRQELMESFGNNNNDNNMSSTDNTDWVSSADITNVTVPDNLNAEVIAEHNDVNLDTTAVNYGVISDINQLKHLKEICPPVTFDKKFDATTGKFSYQIFNPSGQYGYSIGGGDEPLSPFNAAYETFDAYLTSLPVPNDDNMKTCATIYSNSVANFGLCDANQLNQILAYDNALARVSGTNYGTNNSVVSAIKSACNIVDTPTTTSAMPITSNPLI